MYRGYSSRSAAQNLAEIIDNLNDLATDLLTHAPVERSERDAGSIALVTAQAMVANRQYRTRYFRPMLFGEASWDILLDLFIQKKESKLVSVSSVAVASGVPHATALRYISKLEQDGLLIRSADPKDSRRIDVELSDRAVEGMTLVLLQLHDCLVTAQTH